eukprot:Em0019g33a
MMTQEKLTLDVIQALIGSEVSYERYTSTVRSASKLLSKVGLQRQLDAKVGAAILTGINRHSHLQGEIPSLEDHLHTLFKVVHVGPVATGIQSLMLLYQIMESKQAVYYQALYTKLLDPALRNLSGQGTCGEVHNRVSVMTSLSYLTVHTLIQRDSKAKVPAPMCILLN